MKTAILRPVAAALATLSFAGVVAAQSFFPGSSGAPMNAVPGNSFPTQPVAAAPAPMPGPGLGTGQGASSLDQLMAWERQDMGVSPVAELHDGPFHGPTPNKLPGGQVITTKGLLPLLKSGMPVQLFDVLGAGQALPNAQPLAWAAQPGGFDDATQQQLQQVLQQATQGRNGVPLVFYCGGPQCWMSYNAALRAIKLGYRNVLWYRGGMEAWQRAGHQFQLAQR